MVDFVSGQNPFAKSNKGDASWKVSGDEQQMRDISRLAILEQELADNPNDAALLHDYETVKAKVGVEGVTQNVSYRSGENPFTKATPTVAPTVAPPAVRQPLQALTATDKAALAADKVLSALLPDSVRQAVVDVAGGAMEAGGLFKNAPRIKDTTTESGWKTLGRALDPVVNTLAGGAGAATAAAPAVLRLSSPLLRAVAPGAAAGAAGAAPAAVADLVENGVGDAAGTVAKGAAVGGVMGPVSQGIGAAFSRMTDTAQQGAARYLRDALGGRADDLVTALRGMRGNVPGERPTAGLVASQGFPEMKLLEEEARRSPVAHLFQARDRANQQVRENVLERMAHPSRQYGGMPSEAEQLREQVSRPLFARAMPDMVPVPEGLRGVITGPAVLPAARRANVTFEQQVMNARGAGVPPPAMRQPGSMGSGQGMGPSRAIRDPDTGEIIGYGPAGPFMPQQPAQSIADLQKLKFELDKEIGGLANTTDAAGLARRRELLDARQQLVQAMEQGSGMYAVANRIYRNYSAPQNQGQIAEQLLASLRGATGVERPLAFQQAMENAPRTIRRAGLAPRFDRIEDVMTPEQMASINALRRSVQREADYAGVHAPQGVIEKMEPMLLRFEESTPSWFSRAATLIRQSARKIGVRTREDAMRAIDDAMLNPAAMADLVSGLNLAERTRAIQALRAASTNPQLRNALVGQLSNAVTEE